MRLVVKSTPHSFSHHIYLYFYAFSYKQKPIKLLLVKLELILKNLITIPIRQGFILLRVIIFIIDIFWYTKRPHQ